MGMGACHVHNALFHVRRNTLYKVEIRGLQANKRRQPQTPEEGHWHTSGGAHLPRCLQKAADQGPDGG